jgi:hypothetical protein
MTHILEQALRQHNVKVVTINPGNVEHTGMAMETDKTGVCGGACVRACAQRAWLRCPRTSCVPRTIGQLQLGLIIGIQAGSGSFIAAGEAGLGQSSQISERKLGDS